MISGYVNMPREHVKIIEGALDGTSSDTVTVPGIYKIYDEIYKLNKVLVFGVETTSINSLSIKGAFQLIKSTRPDANNIAETVTSYSIQSSGVLKTPNGYARITVLIDIFDSDNIKISTATEPSI